MNQSKFSLADLLTLMGAITFGFFFFLGYNFLTLGDLTKSIIMASAFAFGLGMIAYVLKTLKRASRNFKTSILTEVLLFITYAVVAYFSISPLVHYFAVSQQKEEIQNKIISNITEAEGLFEAYDAYAENRISLYERKLRSIVQAKIVNPSQYEDFGFIPGTSDETQLEAKVDALEYKLKPSNYEEMKEDLTWLSESKSKVENWSPIEVVKIVNELNSGVKSWNSKLNENSIYRQDGEETTDFDSPISFDEISTIFKTKNLANPMGIGIGLGLYLLMLFSYLISKRHDRIRGNVLKLLFGDSTTDDKEL